MVRVDLSMERQSRGIPEHLPESKCLSLIGSSFSSWKYLYDDDLSRHGNSCSKAGKLE